jgi:hypothetical protein
VLGVLILGGYLFKIVKEKITPTIPPVGKGKQLISSAKYSY